MEIYKLINETKATLVCDRVQIASDPLRRMKGLLGRSGLPEGQGLILSPCNSIHTFFMRFAIDVVFLDGQGYVLKVHRDVKPYRVVAGGFGAKMVLEMASGEMAKSGTDLGDRLRIETGS